MKVDEGLVEVIRKRFGMGSMGRDPESFALAIQKAGYRKGATIGEFKHHQKIRKEVGR